MENGLQSNRFGVLEFDDSNLRGAFRVNDIQLFHQQINLLEVEWRGFDQQDIGADVGDREYVLWVARISHTLVGSLIKELVDSLFRVYRRNVPRAVPFKFSGCRGEFLRLAIILFHNRLDRF